MEFGNINYYMLFGGGQILSQLILFLKEQNERIFVVTSSRHAKEEIKSGGRSFRFGDFLKEKEIDFCVSRDANTDRDVIGKITEGTLGMSFGAAWVFKKDFIERFSGRLVNIHGARLPRNRGGGGVSWCILQGDRCGFNLIHQIDEKIDTGVIFKYKNFFFPPFCSSPDDYFEVYNETTLEFLIEFINDIKNKKKFKPVVQQEYFSIYWPRLSTEVHGFINWSWTLDEIERFVGAFSSPFPGASTFVNGKRIHIKEALKNYSDGTFHPFQDGLVYRKMEGTLYVAKSQGSLLIRSVTDEQGRDFGEEIHLGDRLYTPQAYLEKALLSRVTYTPEGRKDRIP